MARLTAKTRSKIPTGKFALAGRRFPIHDKQHAATAKSYASRMVKRGQLTPGQKSTIDAKANAMLGKRAGGRIGLAGGGMGDSGRTRAKMRKDRMKLAYGGAASQAPTAYSGDKAEPRLRGNAAYNNFSRYDGDGC